jgi:iron complex outermembrane receptor protein
MARPSHAYVVAILAAALSGAACGGAPPANPGPDDGSWDPPPAAAAGSAGVLTSKDVERTRVTRAEELLEGRFAGVQVTRLASGGISVQIRGATSVSLNTEPLYVIDGIPVEAEPGGALKWLNPHDIDRIEVLKDPGSTAFYGVRGANGVILITLKH